MKQILEHPSIYHFFQSAFGFFSARLKAIDQYLDLRAGTRIIDIGCGPGHVAARLPEGVIYDGFDLDQRYINFANKHFHNRGSFHCRIFDNHAASEFGPADVVMMNGVLHHMDNETAVNVCRAVAKALKPDGVFYALEGAYFPGQSPIAAWFLRNDRGKFIRTEAEYRALLLTVFPSCEVDVRHDLMTVPYTWAILKSRMAVPFEISPREERARN